MPSNIKRNTVIATETETIDNKVIVDVREVPENSKINVPILKLFKFSDLESCTRNFSQDLLLGRGCFGDVFLGWVDEKSFSPSRCGDGIAVVVNRHNIRKSQGYYQCLVFISKCTT